MNISFRQTFNPFPAIGIYDPVAVFMRSGHEEKSERKENAPATDQDFSHKTMNIILADDDEDDRELFKDAIEEAALNATLDFAEDGQRLLDMLNNNNSFPDLIFLDLNMPNKNGVECLTEIRGNEKLKNIPVVVYSTSSSIKDIDETYQKGANLYVKKPNTFADMTYITRKVLTLDWNKYKPHSVRSLFLFSSKTE